MPRTPDPVRPAARPAVRRTGGESPFARLAGMGAGRGRAGLDLPGPDIVSVVPGLRLPGRGGVTVNGTLGYLPQSLPLTGDLTVAEVMGVADVIRAIDAIEAGDTREEHFTTIGDDWDAGERTRVELDRLGLGDVSLDRPLRTLSGGQVVSLGLAAQLLKRPDVLLLDEPTNNRDLVGVGQLESALGAYEGAFVVVSHDVRFLERIGVDRRLRLSEGRLPETGSVPAEPDTGG